LSLLLFGRGLPVVGFRVGGGTSARGDRAGIGSLRLVVLELSKYVVEALGLASRDGSQRLILRLGRLLAFRAARRHVQGR
jgi:hypothetical protein